MAGNRREACHFGRFRVAGLPFWQVLAVSDARVCHFGRFRWTRATAFCHFGRITVGSITAGSRLKSTRTARSAFPAVRLDPAGPCCESGKIGLEWRDSRADLTPVGSGRCGRCRRAGPIRCRSREPDLSDAAAGSMRGLFAAGAAARGTIPGRVYRTPIFSEIAGIPRPPPPLSGASKDLPARRRRPAPPPAPRDASETGDSLAGKRGSGPISGPDPPKSKPRRSPEPKTGATEARDGPQRSAEG